MTMTLVEAGRGRVKVRNILRNEGKVGGGYYRVFKRGMKGAWWRDGGVDAAPLCRRPMQIPGSLMTPDKENYTVMLRT